MSQWDIFYLWRMVRDSNPRTSCPVSGFQDRRIRPLCQPSETHLYSAGLSNLRFCSLVAPVGAAHHSFALGIADARLANSYARPSHSTALPTIRNSFISRRSFKPAHSAIIYYFFANANVKLHRHANFSIISAKTLL